MHPVMNIRNTGVESAMFGKDKINGLQSDFDEEDDEWIFEITHNTLCFFTKLNHIRMDQFKFCLLDIVGICTGCINMKWFFLRGLKWYKYKSHINFEVDSWMIRLGLFGIYKENCPRLNGFWVMIIFLQSIRHSFILWF